MAMVTISIDVLGSLPVPWHEVFDVIFGGHGREGFEGCGYSVAEKMNYLSRRHQGTEGFLCVLCAFVRGKESSNPRILDF